MAERITLALPSKGVLAEPTLDFLRDCGLGVHKPNPRQYTGSIRALTGVDVLFQRVRDVVAKVATGTVELGVAGYDLVREMESDDLLVLNGQLGYGHCKLQLAVPTSWVDVRNMADLVDVAQDFRQYQRRNLRVATNFSHLTRQFFSVHGLHHFSLVQAEGAIEAAPTLGYADCVVDLSQTGTTLRENHLRPLDDGVLLNAQAALIGSRRRLRSLGPAQRNLVRTLLELIDAALQGSERYMLSANLQGEDPALLARQIMDNPVTRGLEGPTLAPTWNACGQRGYALTLVISADQLLAGRGISALNRRASGQRPPPAARFHGRVAQLAAPQRAAGRPGLEPGLDFIQRLVQQAAPPAAFSARLERLAQPEQADAGRETFAVAQVHGQQGAAQQRKFEIVDASPGAASRARPARAACGSRTSSSLLRRNISRTCGRR